MGCRVLRVRFGVARPTKFEPGPPATAPFDVDLVLDTSTDLVNWVVILKHSAGVLAFIDPSVTLTPSTLTHASVDSARFYRYRVGLIP